MEEMLCSLASPSFLMWVSKGGQFKTRGNVISFSQDVAMLYSSLPRLPEELDILIVRKPDARDPASYKDFRVRKKKVLDFLDFLKANNPYYAHIKIRHPDDVDLPEDGDILQRLPNVVAPDSGKSTASMKNATGNSFNDADDLEEQSFEPEELIQEQTSFVPSFLPGRTELDAIHSGLQSHGLIDTSQTILPWPTIGEPLSEFTTDGLFTKAFPALFPLGKGDFSLPRKKSLALHEWVRHLIRFHDSRFARHPRFRFFALNLIFRHRAMGRGRFLFSRDIGNRDMTVAQLRFALKEDRGHILASKIVRCLQTVRGTRPYWHMEGAKLRQMIEQIGTPTLFYTLSMADLSWPDLHRLMPEDPFQIGLTAGESFRIRSRNLANNPHIVSAYLSVKHQHLRETVFNHLRESCEAPVSDFWYRVEWQARGSGASSTTVFLFSNFFMRSTGHIHGFLWLKDALPIDELDWDNSNDLQRIIDYFSSIITAYNPDPFRPRGREDCLLKDILSPHTLSSWQLEDDHCALCNRCQKHGSLRHGVRACVPAQCYKSGSCRFHFPYACSLEPAAFIEENSAVSRKRFSAVRNDPWMNQHSKTLLLGWRANVDLQPVLDRKAAIKYVSKYASKPEILSQSYRDALGDFCSRMPQELPAESAVRRLFAKMAADRDISAQEAVHLLLGDKLVGCSRTFVNLNANIDAPHLLKETAGLDEGDTTFETTFFRHYENRPLGQSALNAVEFCKKFDVKHGEFCFQFFSYNFN